MFAGCDGLVIIENFLTILIFTLNSFTATGKEKEPYTYIFQMCGDAGGKKNAGLVQKDKDGKLIEIGSYSKTRATRGSMLHVTICFFLLQVDFSEPIMVFSISFQFSCILN